MTGLVSEAHNNDNKFDQDDDGDQIDQNYEDDCDCNDRNHFTEASPTTKENEQNRLHSERQYSNKNCFTLTIEITTIHVMIKS